MKYLLATIKSKGLAILCIVLLTLLTASFFSESKMRSELSLAQSSLLTHVTLNKRLSDENLQLAKELKETSSKQIPIVKEVMTEVCNGVVKESLIQSLPSKKDKVNEEKTADIDDRLPTDLIKLLK